MLPTERKANILLVDDRPENLLALEAILEPLGQNLVRASSGVEALRRLLTDDFALILLDVQMPGMDGFETATLIKEREKTRHIPIIFITAIEQDEWYVFHGYATGAVDYLRKPFEPDILQSKVRVFVELFQKTDQIKEQAEQLRRSEQREAERQHQEREREQEHRHLQELAEREMQLRQFKSTLDATLDAVFIFDAQSLRFSYLNHGAFSRLGYTESEMLSMMPLDIQSDRDEAGFRAMLQPLREGLLPSLIFETQHRHQDGTLIPVEVFLQFIAPPGEAGRFVAIVRDITERKRAEQALKESQDRERSVLRNVLASVTEGRLFLCNTPADLPAPLVSIGEPILLSASSLRLLRRRIQEVALTHGFAQDRWCDLVTSVSEAAMNTVVHARGGEARVHAGAGGTIQVWIQDQGAGIALENLHRATVERGYSSAGTLGHGFWMMLQTCDRVYLLTGQDGTTVVLEQACEASEPRWLTEARWTKVGTA